ncbi:unnamed protein product [Paramecium sonneborni]|uniref:Uncharacterized protein n=1 Tax=Paramecium sonneborni TaxID=65129 RepID=A0A8S1RNH4_9CILI|nr:unnamed protein product [Paramecium sonneborni]
MQFLNIQLFLQKEQIFNRKIIYIKQFIKFLINIQFYGNYSQLKNEKLIISNIQLSVLKKTQSNDLHQTVEKKLEFIKSIINYLQKYYCSYQKICYYSFVILSLLNTLIEFYKQTKKLNPQFFNQFLQVFQNKSIIISTCLGCLKQAEQGIFQVRHNLKSEILQLKDSLVQIELRNATLIRYNNENYYRYNNENYYY